MTSPRTEGSRAEPWLSPEQDLRPDGLPIDRPDIDTFDSRTKRLVRIRRASREVAKTAGGLVSPGRSSGNAEAPCGSC